MSDRWKSGLYVYTITALVLAVVYIAFNFMPTGYQYERNGENQSAAITQGVFDPERTVYDLSSLTVQEELAVALAGSYISELHNLWLVNILIFIPVLAVGLLWLLKPEKRPFPASTKVTGALYILVLLSVVMADVWIFTGTSEKIADIVGRL